MIKVFIVKADVFPQEDFEYFHRYIRKRLDPKNLNQLEIRSKDINDEQYQRIKKLSGMH